MKTYIVKLSTGEQFELKANDWNEARVKANRIRHRDYPGTSIVSVQEWKA